MIQEDRRMRINGKVIAVAAMLAVAGIGGTFAYFNQTLTAANIFDTGKYDTELVEEFKPSEGENWGPGTSVNKDVTIRNTGTLPVVVRVKGKVGQRTRGILFYRHLPGKGAAGRHWKPIQCQQCI